MLLEEFFSVLLLILPKELKYLDSTNLILNRFLHYPLTLF